MSSAIECYDHIVGFDEIDPYGIVHHSVYITWAELGLRKVFLDAGLSDEYEVERISCKYISPAHDKEEITVRTRMKDGIDAADGRIRFPFEIISGRRPLVKGEMIVRKEDMQ